MSDLDGDGVCDELEICDDQDACNYNPNLTEVNNDLCEYLSCICESGYTFFSLSYSSNGTSYLDISNYSGTILHDFILEDDEEIIEGCFQADIENDCFFISTEENLISCSLCL